MLNYFIIKMFLYHSIKSPTLVTEILQAPAFSNITLRRLGHKHRVKPSRDISWTLLAIVTAECSSYVQH